MTDLGAFGGASSSAEGINDLGQIAVNNFETGGNNARAFLRLNGW
jgi:uncharacterized membrane protein